MSGAGHLILIIEDEPQIRHFLRTTLTAEGYRVIESETGERGALEAATNKLLSGRYRGWPICSASSPADTKRPARSTSSERASSRTSASKSVGR